MWNVGPRGNQTLFWIGVGTVKDCDAGQQETLAKEGAMNQEGKVQHAMASTASAIQKEVAGKGGEIASPAVMDKATVDAIIAMWRPIPQKVARHTISKYGAPNESHRQSADLIQHGALEAHHRVS